MWRCVNHMHAPRGSGWLLGVVQQNKLAPRPERLQRRDVRKVLGRQTQGVFTQCRVQGLLAQIAVCLAALLKKCLQDGGALFAQV